MNKKSQNFGEYYQGTLPNYKPSGGIDYSQISSVFARTPEVIEMVTKYNPAISNEVSYIFDFSNAGAYGVYIPNLVEKVKEEELKKQLEQRGYEIGGQGGVLVAYPKNEEKSQEEIDAEIRKIWDNINFQKSEILGVNVNKVKSSCQENMNNLVSDAKNQGVEIKNPQVLWDMLIMLELGATIVHEWEHSRNGDELAAEQLEKDFVNKALPYIKEKYQRESGEDANLIESITTARRKFNWYKLAYIPNSFKSPIGSDLSGRMGVNENKEGIANWSALQQLDQSIPTENRLNRSGMWPLAEGLNQKDDIIELQLRKQTHNDVQPNPKIIYEELLSRDRDNKQAYKTIEQLMEEKRPQPLMIPVKKSASKIYKSATLFGWYNNLEISDGSTIPGLSDRVMAWDDRDESFAREEDWIREQPRYNPEYDLKGFYYRWIEPRFKPTLWDDTTNNVLPTSPAKRFASNNKETLVILKILNTIAKRIKSGSIKSTRLIISIDLYDLVKETLGGVDYLKIKAFKLGRDENSEFIYSVWVYNNQIEDQLIKDAEVEFRKSEKSEIIEDLLGCSIIKSKVISEIINGAKEISNKLDIDHLYLVGAYVREKFFTNTNDVVNLEFTTKSSFNNIKIAELLSKELGIKLREDKDDMYFNYKGIRVDFTTENSKDLLHLELLKRDFTINMLAYDIIEEKVIDYLGVAKEDLDNNIIKTYHDPSKLLENNPIIALRAFKLKLDLNFNIDEDLCCAIKNKYKDIKNNIKEPVLIFFKESLGAMKNMFDMFELN